jgi:anti-sigma regulatory factor (Ser/Thr protein kinase)
MSPRLAWLRWPDGPVTAATVNRAARLSIQADAAEVRRASQWLEAAALQQHVPAEQIAHLDLCLNEVLANILAHGGPSARLSDVQLKFRVQHESGVHEAAVTVSDSGIAFDPLAYQAEPLSGTLEEIEPGGLGLIMMKQAAEHLDYEHSEGRNQLTFTVRWDEAADNRPQA